MAFQEVIDAKQRIIQEFVPGKQVTIAHVIANPKPDLFRKMATVAEGEYNTFLSGTKQVAAVMQVEVDTLNRTSAFISRFAAVSG